jgi:zinc transporter
LSETLPVAAFDIDTAGRAVPAPDMKAGPAPGYAWRWLHFDARDPAFVNWARGHLPPVVSATLTQTETRPRCDPFDDGLILNLRGVNRNPGQVADDMVSLRMWVAPRLIVSSRIRRLFAADDLREGMASGHGPSSPAAFVVALAKNLTDRIETLSLAIEAQTDTLEDAILADDDRNADALGPLRASAIKLLRHIGPQRVALDRLARVADPLAAEAERHDLVELADRTTRAVEEIAAVADRITALQDHIASHTAEQLTRNSFILSVVAAIFLPLGFLTGLFGVNVSGMPGIDTPWAFAALAGSTVVIGLALFFLFRALRWF